MKLQNKYLFSFGTWLNSLSLAGKQSRIRTKVVRVLDGHLKEMDTERKEIAESYSEKDDKGELIITKDDKGNDAYKIADENTSKCTDELLALGDKEVELTTDKEMVDTLKEIVLDTDSKIGPEFSNVYEIACEALEKVA